MRLEIVARNYDRLAPFYDVGNELVFHRLLRLYRYRKAAIESLGDVAGQTVLDVGCGTGNNWPLLVPRLGRSGRLIGVDYSHGMLKKARQRISAAGWSNVEMVREDAATLTDVHDQVDAAVSVWCLGIVHDLPVALTRLVEVTRPGGRIAILDFTPLAMQTTQEFVLAQVLVTEFRAWRIVWPPVRVLELLCAQAVTATRTQREVFRLLTEPLTAEHRESLDNMLVMVHGRAMSLLAWVRQPPAAPGTRSMMAHIDR